ncbi:MAG: replicative DNA helicase [Treponema sp.]|jgi:replicative DNA helicase|nr:replicative DNA helicase [Treponema sp.]
MAAAEQRDKVPPHNIDAEKAVLGAMLIDVDAVTTAIQYLRPGDFFSPANRWICEAVYLVYEKGHQADLLTVTGELQKTGKVDEAGGLDYVASLSHIVPSSANIEYYAQMVQDCSLRRAMLRVAGDVGIAAYDESADARLLLEETQQKLFRLYDERQTAGIKSVGQIIGETIKILDQVYKSKQAFTGIASGFEDLDKLTSGFQPAELIVIGARPGMGKTAIALSMASHISIEKRRPAAFFTLEMSDQALMQRIISSETRISSQDLRTGFFPKSDFPKIWDASGRIYEAPLYIVDLPNMKLMDLKAQARRLRSQQKVEIIFIDYLGLIASENYRIPRHEQVAEISRSLKSLARELNIPIVVLAQLTREAEKEKPNLSAIRESGAIEQDADVVMFIHRPRESDKSPEEQSKEEGQLVNIILAKQRNGPVGTVQLVFMKKYTKFESYMGNRV